jgi:hypothetical protein
MNELITLITFALDIYRLIPAPFITAMQSLMLGFLTMWLLWVFYLAVMNIKRVHAAGKLGKVATAAGLPVLTLGYLLDFVANAMVMTILLFELPQEPTVTQRLKRHKRHSTGWRLRVATWFASELLDNFDPDGIHI